jgi:beta-lactamase superfamily II metal-dependent hydrolase
MFTIEMLPADNGDCLWIEYGDEPKPNRMLIDGGTMATGPVLLDRIDRLDPGDRRFELLVVTHIDTDHIDGILTLLKDPPEGLEFDQVWFNGYHQVDDLEPEYLGALQGEYLSVHLERLERRRPGSWNGAFDGKAVMALKGGSLPAHEFEGGMRLTVLAPRQETLQALAKNWKDAMEEIGMTPGSADEAEEKLRDDARYAPEYLGGLDVEELATADFKEDSSVTNGSSIVLIAEYDAHRCLFGADAVPSEILLGLARFESDGRVPLSAVKVPHHGSRRNNNNDLYKVLDCNRFLVSTNGRTHRHPDAEGIARMLYNKRGRATLFFNYRTIRTAAWDVQDLKDTWKYQTEYGGEEGGLRIKL